MTNNHRAICKLLDIARLSALPCVMLFIYSVGCFSLQTTWHALLLIEATLLDASNMQAAALWAKPEPPKITAGRSQPSGPLSQLEEPMHYSLIHELAHNWQL